VASFLAKGIRPNPLEIGKARALYQGLKPLMGGLHWCQALGAGRFELRIKDQDGSWEFHGGQVEDFRALYKRMKDGEPEAEPQAPAQVPEVQPEPQVADRQLQDWLRGHVPAPANPMGFVVIPVGTDLVEVRYTNRKGTHYRSHGMSLREFMSTVERVREGCEPWRQWTKS
jgi:hypothetical protein